MRWSIAGRSAATAATAGHALAGLWNPSSTQSVWVEKLVVVTTVVTVNNVALRRGTTRGTPGSTVAATIDNDHEQEAAPRSGALLDLATYTVHPTLTGTPLLQWNTAALSGGPITVELEEEQSFGVKVAPGTGLFLVTPVAVIGQPADITFVCYEW